jgi:hypothetical protein
MRRALFGRGCPGRRRAGVRSIDGSLAAISVARYTTALNATLPIEAGRAARASRIRQPLAFAPFCRARSRETLRLVV